MCGWGVVASYSRVANLTGPMSGRDSLLAGIVIFGVFLGDFACPFTGEEMEWRANLAGDVGGLSGEGYKVKQHGPGEDEELAPAHLHRVVHTWPSWLVLL